MVDAIAVGISGMKAQQQVVETLSSNIANVNTPSFKRVEPRLRAIGFSTIYGAENARHSEHATPEAVQLVEHQRHMDTGGLKKTGRSLDLAIKGSGFFALQRANGSLVYSRNGDFYTDDEGYLVQPNGLRLVGDIQIPRNAESVEIDASGKVVAQVGGKQEFVGQIELARFNAPEKLAYGDGGLYSPTEMSGEAEMYEPASEVGTLAQGYIETSNVKIVDEFVTLVIAQRAYEANVKMVQAADEMASQANGLLRG